MLEERGEGWKGHRPPRGGSGLGRRGCYYYVVCCVCIIYVNFFLLLCMDRRGGFSFIYFFIYQLYIYWVDLISLRERKLSEGKELEVGLKKKICII